MKYIRSEIENKDLSRSNNHDKVVVFTQEISESLQEGINGGENIDSKVFNHAAFRFGHTL